MPVRAFEDKVPAVADSAWVSEAAYVVGDVVLGEGASIWPGAVVRGDFGSIRIGDYAVVEDNCVVHSGGETVIGDYVLIGHSVVVHCARIGPNCLVGNHSTLLDDAEIGAYCMVASGSLVTPRTIVPDRSFVSGSPATVEPIPERHLRLLEDLSANGREDGYPMMAKRYRAAGL
jgi:carbonic anhydrase/acetyltransferase-like protein (isoleucine patch superfamily)